MAGADPRIEALEGLSEGLSELLLGIEGIGSSPGALVRAREKCDLHFERCQALWGESTEGDAEGAALDDALASAVRLNAIAEDLVREQVERLRLSLEGVREGRQRLRGRGDGGPGDATGRSCDIAG